MLEQAIEVLTFTWPEAPRRHMRISAQAYDEAGEYETLAKALRAEL